MLSIFSINAVKEICSRCPLVMTEELLRDLALYKKSKNKSKLFLMMLACDLCDSLKQMKTENYSALLYRTNNNTIRL